MPGNISIYAAFFFSLAGALLYLGTLLSKRQGLLLYARRAYYFKTAAVIFTSFYLSGALITHKFKYFYVYAHTSTDLPFRYLISAFWAGQEGTFLLWALLGALTGLVIIKFEKEYESPVMFILLVGQAFLLLFLILYSPFRIMVDIPLEGLGLNPLLKDPWMIIHPPVIFIGYAALIIPYGYAVGGLWKKDYRGWISRALPWALFGWFFLGVGIIIGGYWAYKVLGWGGYWGWDPVENASLVPWLTCTALVHGILVQKARSLNIRSNIFLAIITHVLIIYATFLTRSGILVDFSVHAFGETGLNSYMMAFMIVFLVPGAVLFLTRYRDIPAEPVSEKWYSKVSTFSYTILLLTLSAVIITMGTSSPIISGLLGEPAGVDTSFYNMTNAPIVVLLALVLALCPLVKWKEADPKRIWSSLKWPAVFTGLGLAAAYLVGVRSLLKLVFIGSALFALGTNSAACYKASSRGIKNSGGFLAHVGLALMLIGILSSSVLSESAIISLKENETKEALGYSFTYEGSTFKDDKEALEVRVDHNDKTVTATPKMYMAGKDPMLMREPHIIRGLFRDLYLSPLEERLEKPGETLTLIQGESAYLTGYDIYFKEFYRDSHGEEGKIRAGAVLIVEGGGIREEVIPVLESSSQGRVFIPADLAGTDKQVFLEGIDVSEKMVLIRMVEKDSPPPEKVFVMEVSQKPLVSVLAFGSVLLMAGTLIAVWRRFSNYY
ncbi:MAG: hypothetical protein CVU88_02085 [Firmicutes bacterium HGW-Firmicutes-13]|nr:MAG: hypothetical protein CVU88_02085 [Firmicutes bacterium HGW-Firmicutes-13]